MNIRVLFSLSFALLFATLCKAQQELPPKIISVILSTSYNTTFPDYGNIPIVGPIVAPFFDYGRFIDVTLEPDQELIVSINTDDLVVTKAISANTLFSKIENNNYFYRSAPLSLNEVSVLNTSDHQIEYHFKATSQKNNRATIEFFTATSSDDLESYHGFFPVIDVTVQ